MHHRELSAFFSLEARAKKARTQWVSYQVNDGNPKTLGPISGYRTDKTVRSYAAIAKSSTISGAKFTFLLFFAFIVLSDFLGGQLKSSACHHDFAIKSKPGHPHSVYIELL